MKPRTPTRPLCCPALLCAALALAPLAASAGPDTSWPQYGNDPGGTRYADVDDITPQNVAGLELAWTYHTGDMADGSPPSRAASAFETTPLLVEGTLYVCTPFNRVIALDPATGAERWRYDPGVDLSHSYDNQLICRGLASYRDATRAEGATCRTRLLMGTNDGRLVALDAASGAPCADFGRDGQVPLLAGVGEIQRPGEYQVTSPPAVVGDVVVVGSAIGDNQRTNAPSGVVRGFDVRSGALRWAFDTVPAGYHHRNPLGNGGSDYTAGSANAWAPLSVDAARDLVFVPTGNSSPDYYGGERGQLDRYASSVVALRGSTGQVVWSFQTVHHDLWDFDVPAQPTLFELERDGQRIPALAQGTKMGFVFVLDRETGKPLLPVEERPVPQGGVAGEQVSPTQPFPVKPPPLVPTRFDLDEVWGLTPLDRWACRRKLEGMRNDGIFTPPSLEGSIMYPGNAGGVNWGGVAVDASRQILVTNPMNVAWTVQLFPAEDFDRMRDEHRGEEVSPQRGTPYGMIRNLVRSPLGIPCNPPPWGSLVAIDLVSGDVLWQRPLGTVYDLTPLPLHTELGTPALGGPVITKSGVVFIGAAMDDFLRAFDLATGRELWKGRLPAGGQATPMTYRFGGRQYVVIAAGGNARAGTRLGDAVVAFALPQAAD